MNTVRSHLYMKDRYFFDCGMCQFSNGYAQVDTRQDASYYGNWANPFTRTMVTYCEGDVTIRECETDEEFVEQIRSDAKWHDDTGHGPMLIDTGYPSDNPVHLKFVELGLDDLIH